MTGGSRTRAASRSWTATCVRCIRRSRPVSTSAATSSGRCWTTSSGPRVLQALWPGLRRLRHRTAYAQVVVRLVPEADRGPALTRPPRRCGVVGGGRPVSSCGDGTGPGRPARLPGRVPAVVRRAGAVPPETGPGRCRPRRWPGSPAPPGTPAATGGVSGTGPRPTARPGEPASMGVLSLRAPHRHHDLAGSLRRPRAF